MAKRFFLVLLAMLLALSVFTACDDDDDDDDKLDSSTSTSEETNESSNTITEDEYELINSIISLMDDADDYARGYLVCDVSDSEENYPEEGYEDGVYFYFIDEDGDEEYDEGESIIYTIIYYYYGEAYGEDYDGEIDYDYDEVRVYTETFDYTSQDGSAVSGSFTRITVYVGYDDFTSGDADTYTQYRTYIYDLSATVDGEEHTLEMTLYQTHIYEGTSDNYVVSKTWTGSEAVLDGVEVTGYEDLANAE